MGNKASNASLANMATPIKSSFSKLFPENLISGSHTVSLYFERNGAISFRTYDLGDANLTGDMKLRSIVLPPKTQASIIFGQMGQTGEKTYYTSWQTQNISATQSKTVLISTIQGSNFPYMITISAL